MFVIFTLSLYIDILSSISNNFQFSQFVPFLCPRKEFTQQVTHLLFVGFDFGKQHVKIETLKIIFTTSMLGKIIILEVGPHNRRNTLPCTNKFPRLVFDRFSKNTNAIKIGIRAMMVTTPQNLVLRHRILDNQVTFTSLLLLLS